jgi:hypothetical protein
MNAIILKGAALRQSPLPQSGPRAKTIAHPWYTEAGELVAKDITKRIVLLHLCTKRRDLLQNRSPPPNISDVFLKLCNVDHIFRTTPDLVLPRYFRSAVATEMHVFSHQQ